MKKPLFLFITLCTLGACAGDDATEKQHRAQAWANHMHRLAWQKAHPKEWEAQKAQARADALKKAEAAQKRRAAEAAREAAQARYAAEHTPCKEFGRGLESLNAGDVIASYDCREVGSDGVIIHITVRDAAWQYYDYDQRLQLAKGLWGACVKYAHPQQADSCHVRLVGEAGEDLGGSNSFAGSMIDVNKE